MSRINVFCKKCCILFLQAYIMIMAVIYPLYIRWVSPLGGSYGNIGKDKYLFYQYTTMSMLAIVFVFGVVYFFTGRDKKRFSSTELAVIFFTGSAILSFLLSSYQETAWMGTQGWYMGLGTLLLITVSYLFISRMWEYSDYVWAGFLVGSAIVYVLGICNRFSFYPIPFEVVAPDFISTLGNINWFCSYFSVMWPIGACFYIFTDKGWVRIVAGVYTAVAFGAGVTQGSSSAFLSFLAVFYLLLFACMGKWEQYGRRWMELAAGWCLVCQAIRILRRVLPGRYNYETENLCGMVTGTSFTFILLILLILLYIITRNRKPRNSYWKPVFVAVPIVGIVIYFLLVAINTLVSGGVPGLTNNSLFIFNQTWGNARGATWKTGMELFSQMNLGQKFFGVGPDCFVEYLYNYPDIIEGISGIFNGATLKNAHNEWITLLVNTGIIGTAAYALIFISLIIRFMKKGMDRPVLYIPAACAFSYMIHNMVSFGQVLNMPFVFIIMGIGESCFRQSTQKGGNSDEETARNGT